jgi:hypothetical protein
MLCYFSSYTTLSILQKFVTLLYSFRQNVFAKCVFESAASPLEYAAAISGAGM